MYGNLSLSLKNLLITKGNLGRKRVSFQKVSVICKEDVSKEWLFLKNPGQNLPLGVK